MYNFDNEGERKCRTHHIIDASEDRVMLFHDVVMAVIFDGRTAILRSEVLRRVISYLGKSQTRLVHYD